MAEAAEPRVEHEEAIPFLIVVDCVAAPDETGMLPFAVVLEEIRQSLAARTGMEVSTAHVSIRDHRDEVLHAIEAAGDEEDRRRG